MNYADFITKYDELTERHQGITTVLDNKILNHWDSEVDMIKDGSLTIDDINVVDCYIDPNDEENLVIGEESLNLWYKDLKEEHSKEDVEFMYKCDVQKVILLTTSF